MSFWNRAKDGVKNVCRNVVDTGAQIIEAAKEEYEKDPAKYNNIGQNISSAAIYYGMPNAAQHFSKNRLPILLKETGWLMPGALHSNLTRRLFLKFQLNNFSEEEKEQVIGDFFEEYFLKDNCYNLRKMLKKWQRAEFFSKRRISILYGCVKVINKLDKRTASNVVFPTIVSQIEGLWVDILKYNGESVTPRNKKELLKKFILENDDNYSTDLYDIAENLLIEELFKHTKQNEDINDSDFDYSFSRNKVLHGEYTKYGQIKNVLKAFLLLDFLFEQTFEQNPDKSLSDIVELHQTQYLEKYSYEDGGYNE